MYLTRVTLNPRRRATSRLLASPRRVHGAVGQLFPPDGRPDRALWRTDETPSGTYLYVLSDVRADPTGVVEEYGWPHADQPWLSRDYGPVLSAVVDGRRFGFRTCVNPVTSVRPGVDGDAGGARGRGKRVAHVTAAQQLAWFTDRSDGWGFTVDGDGLGARLVERRVRTFDREGRTVTLSTAVVEGVLAVTTASLLQDALVRGIGPAKAYGCGLLTLAPAGP